ncbi:MAG TPA: hypothetical protein VFV78_07260 [Vicinamibacterales bacterium]|nr:hypothetical protein [Vicinamibacterales bacterium]
MGLKHLGGILVAAAVLSAPARAQRFVAQESPSGKTVEAAFASAYNLDFDEALASSRRAIAADPSSARAHRSLAAILWMQHTFERGAITVDHALGGISVPAVTLGNDADEFLGALDEATRLAERAVKRDGNDIGARFESGAAYGLRASYRASFPDGYTGAFRYARRAFETQSDVLARDPDFAAAGLIAGYYRYQIASQNAAVRFFAFFAGFVGDKEKAMALLEAASHDPLTRVDAKTTLLQIYSREGRYNEALRITRELGIELPRNRLIQYEQGAAAIRAGRSDDADVALSEGLAALEGDTRPKIPGERALWLYKRGLARLNLGRLNEAADDLRVALASQPLGWTAGRIHVALGRIADLSGNRAQAIGEYSQAKAACQASPDAHCRDEARAGLRQPFTRGSAPD